jgi:hypothetical protein
MKHARLFLGRAFAMLLSGALLAGCARMPAPLASPLPAPGTPANEAPADSSTSEEHPIRPYEEVITSKAVTQKGLFDVHQVGDKYYFEIPKTALGKDMLWHVEVSAAPPGLITAWSLGDRMVQWERHGKQVLVKDFTQSLNKRAGGKNDKPEAVQGVSEVTLPATMLAFPIEAEGKDGSLVIDVTRVFAGDFPEFSAVAMLNPPGGQAAVDTTAVEDRSYIQEIMAFPGNVEVRNLLTFAPDKSNPDSFNSTSVSIELRHSLLPLPEQPAMARYADPRVGFFNVFYEDYSYSENDGIPYRELIQRYHLEKKDPQAAVSEPVEPIVFYISPNVPAKWRPYIKKAVEAWQPAFEAAGFSNAILARDAPTVEEDPSWNPFDARYSVIQWAYMPALDWLALAMPMSDPRSGAVLFSRIYAVADIVDRLTYEYFAQVSALDERAKQYPLPDELAGELLQSVISHEVGHALGLTHNFKASQAYSSAQLRDPKFVEKNGITASIMSYSAYNFIAQPGDGVTQLIPRLGPYDTFAIKWGYTPIVSATSPASETVTLDAWAAEQVNNPWLDYDGDADMDDDTNDPMVQQFNLGSDRLASASLGMKNFERSLEVLLPVMVQQGRNYERLRTAYVYLLGNRLNLLSGVATVPGGVTETRRLGGRADAEYTPVPVDEQRAAVKFVMDNLQVPAAFLRPDVMYRFTPTDVMEPLQSTQMVVLNAMLSASKYRALNDIEAVHPDKAYPLTEYLSDVQKGLWQELESPTPAVHPMRRALQRAYLNMLETQMMSFKNDNAAVDSYFFDGDARGTDIRAVARASLRTLLDSINTALPNTADSMTKAHLEDARDKIESMLKI